MHCCGDGDLFELCMGRVLQCFTWVVKRSLGSDAPGIRCSDGTHQYHMIEQTFYALQNMYIAFRSMYIQVVCI
jgi:hypothetical protein